MRKRLDVIAQLIEATKGYTSFEQKTLEAVTRMRSTVMSASPKEVGGVDRESRQILAKPFAVAESYPVLRTAEAISNLMNSVKSIEDEVARLRYTCNNIVQEYNTRTETFPSNIIAKRINAGKMPYLEVGGAEIEERPRISLR